MGFNRASHRPSDGEEFQIGVQLMRNALKSLVGGGEGSGGNLHSQPRVVGMTLTRTACRSQPTRCDGVSQQDSRVDVKVIAEVDSMHFKCFGEAKSTAEVARSAKYVGADAVSLGDPDERKNAGDDCLGPEAVPGLPIIFGGLHQPRKTRRG